MIWWSHCTVLALFNLFKQTCSAVRSIVKIPHTGSLRKSLARKQQKKVPGHGSRIWVARWRWWRCPPGRRLATGSTNFCHHLEIKNSCLLSNRKTHLTLSGIRKYSLKQINAFGASFAPGSQVDIIIRDPPPGGTRLRTIYQWGKG